MILLEGILNYLKTPDFDKLVYEDLEIIIDLACYLKDDEISKLVNEIDMLGNNGNADIFVIKYKVINKNGSTTNNTVNDIGKYLLIAQIYNYLLHQNPASNNEQNLTAWVKSCSDMKSCLAQIGTVAINEIKDSNEEFIKNIYKSILGREADTSGLNSWVNSLNNGTTRSSVLNGFIASEEAIMIYSLWGY